MYKSKLSSCLNHKHLDNKILVSKKNYIWRMCRLCGLIYIEVKNKNDKYYQNKSKIFDNFNEGNSYEFLSILKKLTKLNLRLNRKKWLDFGCGAGQELKIAKQHGLDTFGVEPNKKLFSKCKNKKLKVVNNIKKIKGSYNFIFTRNALKYSENFPLTFSKLSGYLKNNGILIIRDKYFDYMPIKKSMNDKKESLVSSTFLYKNTILNYLKFYNYEIFLKKFYFDGSFFIIAKKHKKKFFNEKNIQVLDLKDGKIFEAQILIRKFINMLIINLKRILN